MSPLKKILITAGPTREMLDPVRFLSNLSTGRMGYVFAETARAENYQVTLISGPTALQPPRGVRFISVTSARDMELACRKFFPKHDALIMTAAVCDFTARTKHPHKIHRTNTKRLMLKQTPDIVARLAKRKGRRVIIGFCLETRDWLPNAARKLKSKNLDGIVANYYRQGHIPFGNRNINTAFLDPKGVIRMLRRSSKKQIAVRLLAWMKTLASRPRSFPKAERKG